MDRHNPINSEPGILNLSHAQVFVYMLLAVVTILFLFLTNAYVFRMNFEDWQPLPVPSLLWVNTCSLVVASIGFFYLITALHGLHISCGVVAWMVITKKSWNPNDDKPSPSQVSLLATYWHYLLLIWVMMFGLFLST